MIHTPLRSQSMTELNRTVSPEIPDQNEIEFADIQAPEPPMENPGGERARVRDRSQSRRRATIAVKQLETFRLMNLQILDVDDLAWQIREARELLDELNVLRIQAPDPEFCGHQKRLEQAIFKSERLLNRAEAVQITQTERHQPIDRQVPLPPVQTPPAGTTRLPEIKLTAFSGSSKDWPCFWQMFCVSIDNSDLSNTEKLIYLKSLLTGEAKLVIEGFEISEINYEPAKQALLRHFDRPAARRQELLIQVSNPPSLDFRDIAATRKKLFEYSNVVRQLKALGINEEQFSLTGLTILQTRLSPFVRAAWIREKRRQLEEPSLSQLLEFLTTELEVSEELKQNDGSKPQRYSAPAPSEEPKEFVNPWTSPQPMNTTLSVVANSKPSCIACGSVEFHRFIDCQTFISMSPRARYELIKQSKLCFRCFGRMHKNRTDCRQWKVCRHCQSDRHHSLLCSKWKPFHSEGNNVEVNNATISQASLPKTSRGQENQPNRPRNPNAVEVVALVHDEPSTTTATAPCLATVDEFKPSPKGSAFVKACKAAILSEDQNQQAWIYAFLDEGSTRTYILKDYAKALRLPVVDRTVLDIGVYGGRKFSESSELVEFWIQGKGQQDPQRLQAWTTKAICPTFTQGIVNPLPEKLQKLGPWADVYDGTPRSISLLIGADNIWDIITGPPEFIDGYPAAVPTKFGYTFSGCLKDIPSEKTETTLSTASQSQNEPGWELDDIGIHPPLPEGPRYLDPEVSPEVPPHYRVALPFRGDRRPTSNFASALRRHNRFISNTPEDKIEVYGRLMDEMRNQGIVSLATSDREVGFYLPHHGVWQNEKCRIVFDGSAKDYSGLSLNSCFDPGPNMLSDLINVLLRFRQYQYVRVGDVKAAFHQVELRPVDRKWCKFVWKLQDFEFCRVPFGLSCSPFLLHSTVHFHFARVLGKEKAERFLRSLYCDDLILSDNDKGRLYRTMDEAVKIFEDAGMLLRVFESSTRILGVGWEQDSDKLTVFPAHQLSQDKVTRRTLLSFINGVFDPLGIVAPWTLKGRLLFQKTYTQQLDWDDSLPEELKQEVLKWTKEIQDLTAIKVDRCLHWSDSVQLHIFCDASSKAFSFVAYVVSDEKIQFLFGKTRVAPRKPALTIPRLELLAVLIGTRFGVRCHTALGEVVKSVVWTDSTCVLQWLESGPTKRDVFVSNRLKEINAVENIEFRHIPSELNPADVASRSCDLKTLAAHPLYHRGPSFLLQERDTWPVRPAKHVSTSSVACPVMETATESPTLLDNLTTKFSCLKTATSVLGYVRRFIRNCRRPKQDRVISPIKLTQREKDDALKELIGAEQELAYSNEIERINSGAGLLRSSTLWRLRPQMIDNLLCMMPRTGEEPLPILPPKTRITRLIIDEAHKKLLHQGSKATLGYLRQNYCVPKGRTQVRQALYDCQKCKRWFGQPFDPPEGELAEFRRKASRPWSHTGLDFFGPLLTANRTKAWCLLFTCSCTRAVHLELVEDSSAVTTLLAIRRFLARRVPLGLSIHMHSDNAATFRKLKEVPIEGHYIEWSFIPSRSPHWGGWWERLIQIIKRSIRVCLYNKRLTYRELETFLMEVERVVNSRPILPLTSEEDSVILTPSDFLVGQPPNSDIADPTSNDTIRNTFQFKKGTTVKCWKIWFHEYLQELRNWSRRPIIRRNLPKIGDVVLVHEKSSRARWPVGRITKIFKGKDGAIRSAEVCVRGVTISRAVGKLYPLETTGYERETVNDRPKRVIRPPTGLFDRGGF